jgi:DNA polymerase (family 10)
VAAIFYRLAELHEIEDANPFRVRAYRRAAATLEDLSEPVADLVAQESDLTELSGAGEDLAGKIREICETGRLAALEAVEACTPSDLARLAAVPGLGPKRVKVLHEALGVCCVEDLIKAAKAGRVRGLPRFGEAFETRLLQSLAVAPAREPQRLAHASRLDLDDLHVRAAKAAGVPIAISSDAHSTVGLANVRFGVDQARRG